jgi:SAM-dependent methyltransferase
MSTEPGSEPAAPPTADKAYADRLNELQGKRWKKILHVQAPWKAHMRYLKLGRVLDVGSGNGRNLHYLDKGSVGVDHNAFSIEAARNSGVEAYTVDEFFADPELAKPHSFDSMLAAHLVEHLQANESREILRSYLPMIRPGGRVVLITPQERGFASDATHVLFADFAVLDGLAEDLGLEPVRHYSFPFPRFAGKPFIYNEFVHISRVPSA